MDLATEGLTRQDRLSDESKHQKDRHWYGSNMEEPRCGRFPVGKKNRTVVWADWHLDQSLPAFFVAISMLQLPHQAHFFSSLTPHLQHCFPTGPELRYCHWQCCKLFLFPPPTQSGHVKGVQKFLCGPMPASTGHGCAGEHAGISAILQPCSTY